MREISVTKLTQFIAEHVIQINYELSPDMELCMNQAAVLETSELGQRVMSDLLKNLEIAREDHIPICQDTGMVVVFVEVGQEVHFIDGDFEESIHEGVRIGYREGYLRKSMVSDPLLRVNTGDNTPAIIHTRIVSGNQVKVTLTCKGFGSENTSQIFMLKPADGVEGVKHAILQTVKDAGPNPCPPIIVGVGIGGNFELSALLAKQALTREIGVSSKLTHIREIEEEMLVQMNQMGIGPAGLGGNTTALAVHIETYATHIAGLPVAVNICCHANRHVSFIL